MTITQDTPPPGSPGAHPQLRPDVEILRGMDDHPLAFDPISGKYHRLTDSSAALIRRLDGSASLDDIASIMASRQHTPPEQARERLDRFVGELGTHGLLLGSTAQVAPPGRFSRTRLMPRYLITRTLLPRLLEPLAQVVRLVPGWLSAVVFLIAGLVGGGYALNVFASGAAVSRDVVGIGSILAIPCLLAQIFLHESMHAMVAQVLRRPVRGLGVALLFYFMPLAYVDRTDAYRLPGRGGRVMLALAGPLSDGVVSGVTAYLLVTQEGVIAQTCAALLVLQILNFLTNLNPMLPSDGYCAIEAGFGLIDPRGRAFTLIKHRFTGAPLPSYLHNVSTTGRRLYLVYGVLCVLYAALLAYFVIGTFIHSFQISMQAVS